MSSSHHARLRTSPTLSRMTAVKTRPGPIPASSKLSLKGNGKAKQAADKANKEADIPLDESDDDMATSFLQFWSAVVPLAPWTRC